MTAPAAATLRAAPRHAPPGGAVVLGASYRALAVVRSLGRAGVPVAVVQTDDHSLAATSRYATLRLRVRPGSDPQRRRSLLDLAGANGVEGWVLMTTGDEDAALVAREREALSQRFVLTTPPWPVLRLAYDKRETHALAAALGLAQPRTEFPALEGGLAAAAPRFPAVIKPAVKASRNALTHDKAWRVDDAAELATRWAEACRLVDSELLMVQELIDGSEQLSFAALCRDGEVLASLTARRRRQHPGDFGRASTYVETIDDASLERDASALLRAMGYTGIVEVEYKRDPSTGANLLLDVNPRAWGWQSLGAHAGVDFPLLLWRMALGEDVPRARARAGERWIRLLTDVPAAWEQHRRGRLSVADWLRSLRGPLAGAVFAPDDPLPALTDVALLATVAARRALRPGTC